MDLDERTIAEVFRAAGYATASSASGTTAAMALPPNAGALPSIRFHVGHWGHYFDPVLEHNGNRTAAKATSSTILPTTRWSSLRAIASGHSSVTSIQQPHSHFQVPDRFYEKFKDHPVPMRESEKEELDKTRGAGDGGEHRWNVGRVLARLDELKLSDNTVVSTSPTTVRTRPLNGGMKGRKGSTDEGGVAFLSRPVPGTSRPV
jgi:arylsulfatase A-like enzyme